MFHSEKGTYVANILSRLLHFSLEHQTQSPEGEEKFTLSFRLVNTLKLRNMATQRGLQIGSKSLLRGRKGDNKQREEKRRERKWKEEKREGNRGGLRRGEREKEEREGERLKAGDPCVTYS